MKVVVGSRHVTLAYLSLHALASHDLQRLKENPTRSEHVCNNIVEMPTSYMIEPSGKIASLDDQAMNVNLAVSASIRLGSTQPGRHYVPVPVPKALTLSVRRSGYCICILK